MESTGRPHLPRASSKFGPSPRYAEATMSEPFDVPSTPAEVRLPRKEAMRLHATLALGLVLCVTAFWFEVSRALGGNALSWAYVFEWPLLAVFAVYMWWQLLHPGRDNRLNRKVKSL